MKTAVVVGILVGVLVGAAMVRAGAAETMEQFQERTEKCLERELLATYEYIRVLQRQAPPAAPAHHDPSAVSAYHWVGPMVWRDAWIAEMSRIANEAVQRATRKCPKFRSQ